MKQALSVVVFVLKLLTFVGALQGFQIKKRPESWALSSTWTTGGDSSIPKNATGSTTTTTTTTSSSSKDKKVYINPNYVPPVVVATPTRFISKPQATTTCTKSAALKGGHCFMEMGESIGKVDNNNNNNNNKLLREAGMAFQDIGMAWQVGDWEAVTYSALDASQTMKLVAQSLNKRHETNELQQAYAGIAVELLDLSKSRERPQAINLQGLSLRLYQASRNSPNDQSSRLWEQASRAAQSLAKQHGANASFLLPRRFQLWWHDRKQQHQQQQNNNNSNNHHDGAFE